MREDKRAEKRAQIAAAAYAAIEERGYAGTSMLTIAKAAKASNETLYNWYGDKLGLFRALVEANAQAVSEELTRSLADARADPTETLERMGAQLLTMLLGERAIALNRAAAGDPTGALGAAIAAGGRDHIAPLFVELVTGVLQARGAKGDAKARTEIFLSLLIGDQQIRRAIHVLPPVTQEDCAARAAQATEDFLRLIADD